MLLTELINCGIKFDFSSGNGNDIEITGITEDSRKIRPGYIFFAIKGYALDGTKFISDAIENGASAIICSADFNTKDIIKNTNVPVIKSDNVRLAFSLVSAKFHGDQPGFVAAVTGTNGKSSIVDFCRQLWSLCGKKSASFGTVGVINSQGKVYSQACSMTTPDPVIIHQILAELVSDDVGFLAIEASSHGLHQYRLDGVKISAAAFTNLSHDHLDYHGSMDEYFSAKMRLFSDLLIKEGTAVVNTDTPEFERVKEICSTRGIKVISYGCKASDITLEKTTPVNEGQAIEVRYQGKQYKQKLQLIGDFQASNILCALGLVLASGIDAETAISLLSKINHVPGRMERVGSKNLHNMVVIDYAHTPDALQKALETLRPYAKNKLWVVFGCGGDRDKEKRPVMGRIAGKLADKIIITDDNPRNEDAAAIRQEIMSSCGDNAKEIAERAEAIEYGIKGLAKGDVLLIAGKGHENYQLIGDKKLEYSDKAVVESFK